MSDIGKIIRVNALPPPNERENNVIYQVAAPGAATYKDYAIDANGDLKTPSYIPLTGTEEGQPLTKNIEVDPSEEGSVGFISNTPDVSEAVITIQEDDSILVESISNPENNSSSIHVHHDTGIEISATTPDDQFSAIIDVSGLQGDDYVLPTSDKHYVQKKYVTDNFTSQTTLNNTLAGYYTSAQTDNLFYDKTEVDAKLSAVYRPKGSVSNFASLPSSGNTEGDVWNLLDTGANYVWVINLNNTGVSGWDKLSETVDLTNYMTLNTDQPVTGKKSFITDGGNVWNNNSARIFGINGYDAGLTFYKDGVDISQIRFDGGGFHFNNGDNSGYFQIKAGGFIKEFSNDSLVLLGGGGHKQVSDFVDRTSGQDITGYKTFFSYLGGDIANNRLWVRSSDGSNPGMSFIKDGVDNAQITYNGAGFLFFNTNSSGYVPIVANGFVKNGSNDNYFLLGGGAHVPRSAYVDTDTVGQSINSRKIFSIQSITGNDYLGAGLEIDGNGSTFYPTISFHQPGAYALTMSVRGNGFNFMDYSGTLLTDVNAAKFIKGGSDDTRVLLGGGGDKLISDFVLDADLNNYVDRTTAQNVGGEKTMTSATKWIKDGDSVSNSVGIIGSGDTNFDIGTLNDKNVVVYRNSLQKIIVGDTITTFNNNINALTISAQNATDRLIYDNIENYGSPLKINANASLGVLLQANGSTALGIYSDAINVNPNMYLSGGGIIYTNGDIEHKQSITGGNATGAIWRNKDGSGDRIAGIGVYTEDGDFRFNYIGWGTSPWLLSTNLAVASDRFTYKDNNVWHSGILPDYRDYGLGRTDAVATADLNNITYTSIQDIFDTTLNRPPDGFGYGSVWTHRKGGAEFTQMAVNVLDGRLYTRGWSNGTGDTGWNRTALYSEVSGKANALENATGIGFSSGQLPSVDGSQYPYFYFDDGTNQSYIAMATQGWVNYRFSNLNNSYVTIDGAPQNILGDKSFASSSDVSFEGVDLNHIYAYRQTTGNVGLVSGHEYRHYDTRWLIGNKRGGSTETLGLAVHLSTNNGSTYDEKFLFTPDGNILTSAYGAASDWNAKVSQSQLTGYVSYTGANQPVNIGSQNLSTTGSILATEFQGRILSSSVLTGDQVINANQNNQLYFGNHSIPDVYYLADDNHRWYVKGNQQAILNDSGLAITGTLNVNGSSVITEVQRGVANGFAPLGSDVKISSAYLPSYVDDVLEFDNLPLFPATGETGKIYIAKDTNLTYRWGGSSYTLISSGAVQSVNGQTGIVNLAKSDIGLSNVDNTSDATKNVSSATKWTTPRTLSYTGDVTGSASVDGSGNVGFAMTLANSGVSAGTYNTVNVDAKGRVLSGSNINYATESYVTDLLQQNYFNQAVADERFVNTEGDETINGNKAFTSSPAIPAATNGDHAVNLEQLTASLSTVISDNDGFNVLEVYKLIDSNPFYIDDIRIKKYNIVFDGSSNGSVNIIQLRDNQYYQFSNISGSGADLRLDVEGYGLVDIIPSGKTIVYMSWGDGKLLKISENSNVSII
ncbi:hypothetical protein [Chryseobacterium taiwanense]|uniref:hypothetical protein n=1 Tax=Chryseobacterium taiwanense TaxID=363331 RepID=UPI000690D08C|nr:hypothetical protein [Chryseobacterium taiwanense]